MHIIKEFDLYICVEINVKNLVFIDIYTFVSISGHGCVTCMNLSFFFLIIERFFVIDKLTSQQHVEVQTLSAVATCLQLKVLCACSKGARLGG